MQTDKIAMNLKEVFEDTKMRSELENAETVAAAAAVIQQKFPEITADDLARFIDKQLAMNAGEIDEASLQQVTGGIAGVDDFFQWLGHKTGKWARDYFGKN